MTTFTYYNEPNQDLMGYNSPLYIGNVIMDRNTFYLIKAGFFGSQSKNLLNAGITYQYDSSGRIISEPGEYSFVYQCP